MTNIENTKRNVVAAVRKNGAELDCWLSPGVQVALKNSPPTRIDLVKMISIIAADGLVVEAQKLGFGY